MLLLLYDESDQAAADRAADRTLAVLRKLDGCISATRQDPQLMGEKRKVLSQRLRELAPVKINEDVAVPVNCMADLAARAQRAARESGARCLIFGHAGLGNLHVNLLLEREDENCRSAAEKALTEIFTYAVECGGTISGEHGIGIAKSRFMAIEHQRQELRLMAAIKEVFDPGGILNPGKILPAAD